MFTKAMSLVVIMLGAGIGPTVQDPVPAVCQCETTIKLDWAPKPPPKCTIPVIGETDAFSVSVVIFPEGVEGVEPGTCTAKAPCTGQTRLPCTFADMAVTVTFAACAAQMLGYPAGTTTIRGEIEYPMPAWTGGGLPTGITQGVNAGVSYRIKKPDMELHCGTREQTATVTFFKSNGQEGLKLSFKFGCGVCKADQ